MLSKVVVHERGDFVKWLEAASDLTKNPEFQKGGPAWAGEQVMKARGCFQCHSTTGVAGTGPSLKDVFGKTETLMDGTVLVDENYVHESIVTPHKRVVRGFQPVMPSFANLKDREIDWIIAYL
jgi:cytochrome c oxidase subunit 2